MGPGFRRDDRGVWASRCCKFSTTGKSQILSFRRYVKSPQKKYSDLQNIQIRCMDRLSPRLQEGDVCAIVTERWCGVRWTLWRQVISSPDETRQRMAKSCGPGAATVASSRRA